MLKDENDSYASPKKLNVDSLTSKIIGDFGRWQLKISILMSLLKLPLAWYQLNIIFLAPPQQFWCAKPKTLQKYTDNEWRKICKPNVMEYPCLVFDPDILATVPKMDRMLIPLVTCKNFVYDHSVYKRTITSDFDLVCEKHWFIHVAQCVLMTGIVIGGIVFGAVADKCGRKKPLIIALFIQAAGSFLVSLSRSFWFFLVNWFILALGCGGSSIISFVVCMEVVSGKWRTIVPVLYQLPFGFGNAVLALLAYWLRDWTKLEFALATISSFFLLYWFWVPESPRWLLATGKFDKAIEVLENIARENKMNTSDISALVSSLPKAKNDRETNLCFMDLVRYKNMRRKTFLLSIIWFFTGLSFFTFSQYLGLVGGNIFLNVAMSGLISIPGGVCCLFIIAKAGRKTTLNVFQIVATVCFMAILILPKEDVSNEILIFVFAGLGFAAMAGIIPALYLFSGELFPTVARNIGVGGVTTFARVASMIAPAVVNLDVLMPGLPIILLIAISLVQMLVILPLPETINQPLPDTLEEAEKFT